MTPKPVWTPRGFEAVPGRKTLVLARPQAVGWARFVLEGGRTLYEAAATQPDALLLQGRKPLYVLPSRVSRQRREGDDPWQRREGGDPGQRREGGDPGQRREGDDPWHGREGNDSAKRREANDSAKGLEDGNAGEGEPPPEGLTPGDRKGAEGVRWVVRRYARDWPPLPVLGDRHFRFGSFRPFHELLASEEARARGISTPQVMAAAVYLSGPFYRADLVTVFVPGANNLAEILFDTARKGVGRAVERLDALQAAGELIRQLASRGLRHRGLHAGNILLRWQGAAPTPLPLGLDRCQVMREGVEASPNPMYRRLRRSLGKWERRTGLRIGDREWDTLERAVRG